MTAAKKLEPLDWQAYLEGEELALRKHEYVNGYVYAMAGGTELHSQITSNVIAALSRRVRPGCRVLTSDLKVHIRNERGVWFYYPDCLVVCDTPVSKSVYRDDPTLVVEVLSPSTRRTDEGEKRENYLSIPTLRSCLLVDSLRLAVTVWRRGGAEMKPDVYCDTVASIPLPEIGVELPLAEIYANVVLPTQEVSEEE